MSGRAIGDVVLVVVLTAAVVSTCWVIYDGQARGLPRRKVFTWAALQWIEFPLFLWLYRRIRPRTRLRDRPARDAG